MIDARDQVGVPIITDCPSYVEAFGVLYEIPADAFLFQAGPIVFEGDSPNDLMAKLYSYTPYASPYINWSPDV